MLHSHRALHRHPTLRPARPLTTVIGDTGLWYVPTGEVLPKGVGGRSASTGRTGTGRRPFSDISNFRGTFAFGATDQLEFFGSIDAQRRIDADRRPGALVPSLGTPMDNPFINDGWQTGFGDITRRGQVQSRLAMAAAAGRGGRARGSSHSPQPIPTTASAPARSTSGSTASSVAKRAGRVELSAFGGYLHRGDPDEFDLSDGFTGVSAPGFPSRGTFRVTAELHGESYFDNQITLNTPSTGRFLNFPQSWEVDSPIDFEIGFTYQARNGFFVGWGFSYGLNTTNREDIAGAQFTQDEWYDLWGNQVRIGWHPGVRIYVPPPPPPPPPTPPPAPANRPPTVKARCEPCVVESAARPRSPRTPTIRMATPSPISGARRRARSPIRPSGRRLYLSEAARIDSGHRDG